MTDQLTKNTTLSSNRPQSMYQFRRSSDSKRFHQFDPHHDDADAELRRQHNLTQSEKAKEMAKAGVKIGMDWFWQKSGILGSWMNKQAGKMGMEAFWPTSLDKECDKCARILYTFTQRQSFQPVPLELDPYADRKTQKVIKKIPMEVIQNAEGLAIFTVFRTGLGWSAASGSGIVISKDSPSTWGPPSGILIHTIGVGFLAGIDVYDAVLVLRTRKAVMSFAKPKVSLGAELAIVAGPVGNGVSLETGLEASPVFAYTKSKGIYGGLQLDGNIIVERDDENARFYGRRIKAEQLLNGGAVAVPRAASGLMATIEAAEGKPVDTDELPEDIDIAPSDHSTGVETLQESRQRARAEAIEAGLVEADPVPSSATLSSPDRALRRRTLPPLPIRHHSIVPAGPNAECRKVLEEAEGEESDSERIKPRSSLPPIPPRPARRFVSSSRASTPGPGEDSMSRRSLDQTSSRLSVGSTLLDPMVVDGLNCAIDKPPAPFKLHSPSHSQGSVKIPELETI